MKMYLQWFILILTLIVISSSGCFGGDEEKDDDENNHDKDDIIIIRIESIETNNSKFDNLRIEFSVGEEYASLDYHENQWDNQISIYDFPEDETHQFRIEITNGSDQPFNFINSMNSISGNITYHKDFLSVVIDDYIDSNYELIENSLYPEKNGYDLSTSGNDGNVTFRIAIEHPPP